MNIASDSILARVLLGKDLLVLPDPQEDSSLNKSDMDAIVGSLEQSFASIGYTLSEKAVNVLYENNHKQQLAEFYDKAFNLLRNAKGADVNHTVFYKNFPNYVLNATEGELYVRAMLHYMSVALKPVSGYVYMADDIEKKARIPFDDKIKPTVLDIVTESKAQDIVLDYGKNLLSGTTALNDKQKTEIKEIQLIPGADGKICPEKFNFKETMAWWVSEMIAKYGIGYTLSGSGVVDYSHMTITDLLRIYTIISSGSEIITNQNIKYVSLPRKSRRFLMDTLTTIVDKMDAMGNFDLAEDEFGSHNFQWNCVFRQIHAGEYASGNMNTIVKACRSHQGCSTIASKVDYEIRLLQKGVVTKQTTIDNITSILKKKPGVYARRLDWMLRNPLFVGCDKKVLDVFSEIADNISLTVLIELRDYFLNRGTKEDTRYFSFECRGITVTYPEKDMRPVLDPNVIAKTVEVIDAAISDKEMKHKVPDGVNFGKVYVSQDMKQYRVPTSARNASGSIKTLPRGSKIKLKDLVDGKFLRVFTHWHNLSGKINSETHEIEDDYSRVDIDLAAQFFDDKFQLVSTVSWNCGLFSYGLRNNQRSEDRYALHSGDVTDAPRGASEFIDIDISKAKAAGVRYVAITNSSFTRTNWKDIPECFSGIMIRSNFGTNTGEIFDPASVKYKFELTQDNPSMNIAFIYDVVDGTFIWVDAPFDRNSYVASGEASQIASIISSMIKPHTTMYDLIMLSSKRFGSIVENPDDADLVFGETEVSKAKDAVVVRPTDSEVFEKLLM